MQSIQSHVYWSGVECAPIASEAWAFFTNEGFQRDGTKDIEFYAWAVRSGDVAAVPTPVPFWLIGSGGIGLLGWKRKR